MRQTRPSHSLTYRAAGLSLLVLFALLQACTKVGLNNNRLGAGDPTIVSIIPNYGPPVGGTTIQIIGTNFTDDTEVSIDGLPCTNVTFVSRTTITCVTPSHTLGSVDVVVHRPARTGRSVAQAVSITASNGFTYSGPLSNSPIFSVTSGGVFTSGPGIKRRTSIAVIGGSVGQTGTGVRKVSGMIGVLSGR